MVELESELGDTGYGFDARPHRHADSGRSPQPASQRARPLRQIDCHQGVRQLAGKAGVKSVMGDRPTMNTCATTSRLPAHAIAIALVAQ